MPDVQRNLSRSGHGGHRRSRSLVGAAVAAALGLPAALTLPGIAVAQQTGQGLEEILVTATRRGDVALQDVPVSVTAVNSEELSRLVNRDISGVAAVVPNFSAAKIASFNAASFAIRGVGQTDIIVYLDAPVAVNVDDFVLPSVQTQLLDTFDIERVEVLRGPQGTLFGKNTTGGLVNVTTKRPEIGEGGVEARALYGSFNHYQIQGALNLPLGETFAMRFVGGYDKSDGFYENGATYGSTVSIDTLGGKWNDLQGAGDGRDLGGTDVMNGRIKALWQPNDDFSALFQYEILRDESDAVPAFNDTPREPGCLSVFEVPPGTPGTCTFLWNSLGLFSPEGDPIDKVGTTNRTDAFMATGRGQRIDVDGFYLNVDWDLGATALAGVIGYREQESRLPNSYPGSVPIAADGEQMSLFDASRDDDRETFQAEVRLSSNTDGAIDWVVGGFYQTNDAV
ncbi:MAG TPA: TonB-dependent receptor plug domain-containing protein, partial [Steroidobacteraceae bacterium]|nr:TonB-dependent receptor plug domain-containing protein [Steroidobacteraceae bacterium]